MKCSTSRKGNCWDNAPMESFWGKMKSEWLLEKYDTIEEAARDISKLKRTGTKFLYYKNLSEFYDQCEETENLEEFKTKMNAALKNGESDEFDGYYVQFGGLSLAFSSSICFACVLITSSSSLFASSYSDFSRYKSAIS